MCEAEYRKRSQQKNVFHMGLITRQGVEKSLKSVSHKKFAQHYPVPPKAVTSAFTSNVTMYHNSIYVAGKPLNNKIIFRYPISMHQKE